MSLACLECGTIGSFNTLIVFEPTGHFDQEKPASKYANFYTDCARFEDFAPVATSRFMIVQEGSHQDSWHTGTDGEALKSRQTKLVSEDEVKRRLPKIFAALAG